MNRYSLEKSAPYAAWRRAPRAAATVLGVALVTACTGYSSSETAHAPPPQGRPEAVPNQTSPEVANDASGQVAGQVASPVTSVAAGEPRDAESDALILYEAGPQQRKALARQQAASAQGMAQMLYSVAPMPAHAPPMDRERYQALVETGLKLAADDPVSTFSIDVDTGAYSNVRRFLRDGQLPPADAVRAEEMINYFTYADPDPTGAAPFSVSTTLAPTPWNPDTQLLRIGIRGKAVAASARPASNLVFLVDVSGSMGAPDKLPLLIDSLSLLTQQLNDRDRVSLVVYAGASGVVLPPTAGDDRARVRDALRRLHAGGSTNGASGIELAYQLAREAYIDGGINRVILATDGDFNVGIADTRKLIGLIERKRASGVSLTTLGFGRGNLNDQMMERIADAGNGNYAYIDSLAEARKVLVDEVGATLQTIASDVKIQVEFNPAQVAEYRLIGYANRQLRQEDFNNDKVDAGDIGAGHSVTALYELTPVDSPARRVDARRYGNAATTQARADELAFVRLRYKNPGQTASVLLERPVMAASLADPRDTSNDYRFAAAVAAFAETLRGGAYLGDYSLDEVHALAAGATGPDARGYRAEFLNLVDTARALSPDSVPAQPVARRR